MADDMTETPGAQDGSIPDLDEIIDDDQLTLADKYIVIRWWVDQLDELPHWMPDMLHRLEDAVARDDERWFGKVWNMMDLMAQDEIEERRLDI